MPIPVWHDDQQGSATVVLAACWERWRLSTNASIARVSCWLASEPPTSPRIACSLPPARYQVLSLPSDRKGPCTVTAKNLKRQQDIFVDKWRICRDSQRR